MARNLSSLDDYAESTMASCKIEIVGSATLIVEVDNIEFVERQLKGHEKISPRCREPLTNETSAARTKRNLAFSLILQFRKECLEPAPGERLQSSKLYASFCTWAAKQNEVPPASRLFHAALCGLGYRPLHSNVNWWIGVRLKGTAKSKKR